MTEEKNATFFFTCEDCGNQWEDIEEACNVCGSDNVSMEEVEE